MNPGHRSGTSYGVDLFWIPLGAGGWFVRLNGRVYEAMHALLERRQALDLYHSALEVHVPEGAFVIENAWPIPNRNARSRGVVVEGPVGSRRLARFRFLRYEIRRWRDGVIPDAGEAVGGPQRVSDDVGLARRLLDLVGSVPALVWGRDDSGAGEMWDSNSIISWLLARSGVPTENLRPPPGGRAPGWGAGLAVATGRHRAGGRPLSSGGSPPPAVVSRANARDHRVFAGKLVKEGSRLRGDSVRPRVSSSGGRLSVTGMRTAHGLVRSRPRSTRISQRGEADGHAHPT